MCDSFIAVFPKLWYKFSYTARYIFLSFLLEILKFQDRTQQVIQRRFKMEKKRYAMTYIYANSCSFFYCVGNNDMH